MEHEKFLKKGKTFLPSVNHPSDELGLSEINVTRAGYVFTLDFFLEGKTIAVRAQRAAKKGIFVKKNANGEFTRESGFIAQINKKRMRLT